MEQKKYLIIIDNFGKIQEVPLESFGKDRLILGSDPVQCDIVIRSNIISHVHGKLKFMGPRVLFADLNSTNGVQFEGRKIAGTRQIHTGDRFVITTGKTNQYIVLTVEQNHRTTQTANIVFKKPEKKMISVHELVEWIIASILVLFIAVSSIIGAGIPAYLNHKFANEKLSGWGKPVRISFCCPCRARVVKLYDQCEGGASCAGLQSLPRATPARSYWPTMCLGMTGFRGLRSAFLCWALCA